MNTQYFRKTLLVFIFSFLFGLLPVSQAVSADLIAPQLPLESMADKIKVQFQDESFTKDFTKATQFVDEVINPHVDFNRVSALVLGKLWKKATKDEKLRFRKEFHTLLVRTYSRAFFEFKDWSVRFLPLKLKEGEKKAIVKTEILQPGLQPLAVNYRMILTKGEWKAYDIMIEGVSLVTNYRTSIKNEFKKKGSLDAVIEHIAKRNSAALS
ncbi:MAG: ABC transporter substrate-binding protein [Methylococcales bacterium]|nr:ABC transporter substrate-binding protein [Methylococcales bacterium]